MIIGFKYKTIKFALVVLLFVCIQACQKCYDCAIESEVVSNGDTIIEPISIETCLDTEIEDYKLEGYDCSQIN